MSTRDKIIYLPNTHLRKKSRRVAVINAQIRELIDEMKAATLDWEASRPHEVGVALAAIQIDQPYRIVIVRDNFEDKDNKDFSVFINPEIVKLEGELDEDFEGCLSVRDIYGKVPRYTKVRIRAIDETGQRIRAKADGFLARVLQHEIDHLNGIVFIDHIEDRPKAFYKLTDEGKLESLDYEQLSAAGIFRNR